MEREDRIRVRAYDIWIAEGCPKDREKEHWERAAAEIDASDAEISENTRTDVAGGESPAAPEEKLQSALSLTRRAA